MRALQWLLLLAAGLLSLAPFVALVGIGAHRHAPPWVVSGSAILLVYAPILLSASLWRRDRNVSLALTLLLWSSTLFLLLPVYFPGERNQGLRTGLGLLGFDAERLIVLPDEPIVARPEVESAEVARLEPLPPGPALESDQISLPYEGEGRRMSVPIVFEDGGRTLEVEMMFDTGATYTTLGTPSLATLGIRPGDDDPSIELHTANGVRTARLVLLDKVWLGDLEIDGVAVAVCDDCAGDDTAGLLGLNVSGGFNLQIDADRREVVFEHRARFDRKLDVKPFVDLDATFTRFPGGRVEVMATLGNHADRPVTEAVASVRCNDDHWTVRLAAVSAGDAVSERRKLPAHEPCTQYEIGLASARW